MSWLEVFLTVMSSLIGMELFAWVAHKYIMHGWGWGWHRDHHEPHDNMFEKNDLFAVVFGSINAAMYIYGSLYWDWLWWFAVGISLYGVIYTLVHDGLVHQRYFRWVPRKGYAKRLVQAHKLHHATIGKEGGVSFGFVFARDPAKLKAELKAQKEAGLAVVRDAVGAGDDGFEVVGRNL
ncbi:sterol desaturase family protein [Porphyrobacter sp. LM 6]|uniref:sterol desaturase family protein n=1 Tax=Porphyrobacter sp. LM 6 TaxID=1896196 RepID=UPI0008476CA4|nr:sterol desaturase family protein [Porphyrobacter sp. LM 6]AOL95534.1 beta-carotene 3-hydroxylase [Porphyrobacter sp. LM 6]